MASISSNNSGGVSVTPPSNLPTGTLGPLSRFIKEENLVEQNSDNKRQGNDFSESDFANNENFQKLTTQNNNLNKPNPSQNVHYLSNEEIEEKEKRLQELGRAIKLPVPPLGNAFPKNDSRLSIKKTEDIKKDHTEEPKITFIKKTSDNLKQDLSSADISNIKRSSSSNFTQNNFSDQQKIEENIKGLNTKLDYLEQFKQPINNSTMLKKSSNSKVQKLNDDYLRDKTKNSQSFNQNPLSFSEFLKQKQPQSNDQKSNDQNFSQLTSHFQPRVSPSKKQPLKQFSQPLKDSSSNNMAKGFQLPVVEQSLSASHPLQELKKQLEESLNAPAFLVPSNQQGKNSLPNNTYQNVFPQQKTILSPSKDVSSKQALSSKQVDSSFLNNTKTSNSSSQSNSRIFAINQQPQNKQPFLPQSNIKKSSLPNIIATPPRDSNALPPFSPVMTKKSFTSNASLQNNANKQNNPSAVATKNLSNLTKVNSQTTTQPLKFYLDSRNNHPFQQTNNVNTTFSNNNQAKNNLPYPPIVKEKKSRFKQFLGIGLAFVVTGLIGVALFFLFIGVKNGTPLKNTLSLKDNNGEKNSTSEVSEVLPKEETEENKKEDPNSLQKENNEISENSEEKSEDSASNTSNNIEDSSDNSNQESVVNNQPKIETQFKLVFPNSSIDASGEEDLREKTRSFARETLKDGEVWQVILNIEGKEINFATLEKVLEISITPEIKNGEQKFALLFLKEQGFIKSGLVISTTQSPNLLKQRMLEWEKTMTGDLKPLFFNEPLQDPADPINFSFGSSSKVPNGRFLILSKSKNISLEYSILTDKIIIATSYWMMEEMVKKVK